MRRVLALLAASSGLALPSIALADHPVGDIVNDGVLLDIPPDGFSLVTDMVAGVLPERIDIPSFSSSDSSGCILGGCAYRYRIEASGMWLGLTLDSVTIDPGTGTLTMNADATALLNDPTEPARLEVFFELAYIDIIDDVCDLYLDPIHLAFDAPMSLELLPDPAGVDVDGDGSSDTKRLEATIPTPVWNWDADSDDFNFGGCDLADVINSVNEVLSFFGLDLYEMILDAFEPAVDAAVAAIPGAVEPLLEDTFNSLVISEVIDLGAPLTFSVWPDTLTVLPEVGRSPGGLRVGLAGAIDVPVAACVSDYVTGGSSMTPGAPPDLAVTPDGLGFAPHVVALADDDFVNYALYAFWAGGLLCYDIRSDDPTLELPVPIDTLLLTLLAPGVFDAYFPETMPMSILTDPKAPPIEDPAGPHDLDVLANDLGLSFISEIDGRRMRLFTVDVDATAGIDMDFDGKTGNLQMLLDVSGDSFVAEVIYNELTPASNEAIAGQFSALYDILVAPIISDLDDSLLFPISTLDGLGVIDLDTAEVGANGDWLGAYVYAGEVAYYQPGCDTKKGGETKSCDTKSCEKGCSSSGGGVATLGFPLIVALLRRRRSR